MIWWAMTWMLFIQSISMHSSMQLDGTISNTSYKCQVYTWSTLRHDLVYNKSSKASFNELMTIKVYVYIYQTLPNYGVSELSLIIIYLMKYSLNNCHPSWGLKCFSPITRIWDLLLYLTKGITMCHRKSLRSIWELSHSKDHNHD